MIVFTGRKLVILRKGEQGGIGGLISMALGIWGGDDE